MQNDLTELKDNYEKLRELVLEEAEKRYFRPDYRYENQSERETPIGFSNDFYGVNFENTKLFEILVRGNLDQIKEVLGTGELKELIREIFGPYHEDDTQKNIENQSELEMAA